MIAISSKLLGHITLGPELTSLYGIQGSTFKDTIGYLYQYLEHKSSQLPELHKLTAKIKTLLDHEEIIRHLDTTSKEEHHLHEVSAQIAAQIMTLSNDDDFLLLGGFGNALESGHGIIYRFQKTPDHYQFYVINSGAGLNTHESWSTPTGQVYSSAKKFTIPQPISSAKMTQFIRQLIVPQLTKHPSHDKSGFDEYKLDKTILREISLLHGKRASISLAQEKILATLGQMSGTCAQKSLHQLLKFYFNDTQRLYKRFMFEFKLYAIQDFINTHPAPRTYASTQLIIKALENNLKILQATVFTKAEKEHYFNELAKLKNSTLRESSEPVTKLLNIPAIPSEYKLTVSLQNKQSNLLNPENQSNALKEITRVSLPEFININKHESLFKQLERIIQNCQEVQDRRWVRIQIEQTLLNLPLPDKDPHFYQGVQLPQILEALTSLQRRYLEVTKDNKINCILTKDDVVNLPPQQYLTHWSLLALHDYFETQLAVLENRPSFHAYTEDCFRIVWSELRESSALATHDPDFDKRFEDLIKYSQTYEKKIQDTPFFFATHYQTIIKRFPHLMAELETRYYKREWPYTSQYRYLADKGYAALLYLSYALQYEDPTFDKRKFEPLLHALQQQKNTENFIAHSLSVVLNKPITMTPELFTCTWNDRGELLIEGPLNITDNDGAKTHAQYSEHLPYPANDLNESTTDIGNQHYFIKKITPNEAQLKSVSKTQQRIHHLKYASDHQINLTVDLLRANPYELQNPYYQQALEQHLSQPALLQRLFTRDPSFVTRFEALIQTGFQYFIDEQGVLNKNGLFLIQTSTWFNQYIAKFTKDTQRLTRHQAQLHTLLTQQSNAEVRWHLHHAYLETYLSRYEIQPQMLQAALTSFVYLNNHTVEKAKSLDNLNVNFSIQLQRLANEQIILMLAEVVQKFDILTFTPQIQGEYPIYTMTDPDYGDIYQLNMASGQFLKNNKRYEANLSPILHKMITNSCQVTDIQNCFVSESGKSIEFTSNNKIYKLSYTYGYPSEKIDTFRKFAGQTTWYHSVSATIGYSQLPACLRDRSIQTWVNDTQHVILTRAGEPIYHTLQEGQLQEWDGCAILQPTSDPRIARFEDLQFVCLAIDANTHSGYVDFVRYGLRLQIKDNEIYLPHTDLQLIESSLFASEIACLHFKKQTQEQCIIPIQRAYLDPDFTPSAESIGNYFPCIHDRSNYINRQGNHLDPSSEIYQNTEHYITCTVIDGDPKPKHAADALYLCYLYLVSHQPEKAWSVLEQIPRAYPLEGTKKEQHYLNWILYDLPYVLPKSPLKSSEQNAKLDDPPYLACQLKALALFTDRLEQGKTEPQSEDLYKIIAKHYTKFQLIQRHVPAAYHLNDRESLSLLTYYYQTEKRKWKGLKKADPKRTDEFIISGAMGYQWRLLTLKKWYTEYQRLHRYCTNNRIPKAIQQRMDELNKALNKEIDVMNNRTNVKFTEHDVSLPLNKFSADKPIPLTESQEFQTVKDEAMCFLEEPFNDALFIKYLPVYLRIALNKDAPESERITNFCEGILLAKFYDLDFKKDTGIIEAVQLLYHTLFYPDAIQEQCTQLKQPLTLWNLQQCVTSCKRKAIFFRYEIQNNCQEILTNSAKLLKIIRETYQVEQPLPIPEVVPLEEYTMHSLLKKTLHDLHAPSVILLLQQFCSLYPACEVLENDQNKKTLSDDTLNYEQKEQIIGERHWQTKQKQHTIATQFLNDSVIQTTLLQNTLAFKTNVEQYLKQQWQKALKIANQASRDDLAQRFKIERASLARNELSKKDLLRLYLHADHYDYIEHTGLNDEEITDLHKLMQAIIIATIQLQHFERLLTGLKTFQETSTDTALHEIAQILTTVNHPEALRDPRLMLFQYYENILLRPRQIEVLKNLLSSDSGVPCLFQESIEKIIMGGGKSKVLLPLLAQMKTNSSNLVIIEVPRALLNTNYHDLNQTSQALFDQRAFLFYFNRDSDCSAANLKRIYQHFVDVMNNKSYLVTTGESMQSLQLKYLELCTNPPQNLAPDEWRKQVRGLARILRLLKDRGDVIIDEVHLGLWSKKKLNYTVGESLPINQDLIQHSVALYQFLSDTEASGIDVDMLLNHPKTPFNTTLLQEQGVSSIELRDFLLNQTESEALQNASDAFKSMAAFYKEQLLRLPRTLASKYKVQYGPSLLPQSPEAQPIAIPYIANQKPSEHSHFSDPMDTVNYTIQSLLLDGLSAALLSKVILHWQIQARQEWKLGYPEYLTINNTPTALRLASYFEGTGFNLQTIAANDEDAIQQILPHFKFQQDILFETLEKHVLPQVLIEPAMLHSDAYNHVDMFHSVQGLSGTPSNYATFHQRLKFNLDSALGTDGYIQCLLKEKKTCLHAVKFQNSNTFIQTVFESLDNPKQTYAFIDVCATFVGIDNMEVAQALASYATQHRAPIPGVTKGIKYILYFDANDILCALDVNNPNEAIILNTSDPVIIDQILTCTPEERFTYYDQAHTTGTDLRQAPLAIGVVFIDEKTSMQSFLQGSLRMRGIEQNQQIEIITPPSMRQYSLTLAMNLMTENERRQLLEDNFFATIEKMDNIIRNDLLSHIHNVNVHDVNLQQRLIEAFKKFFIETQSLNLYQRYGGILHEQDTLKIFEAHKELLIAAWQESLTFAQIATTETQNIAQTMDQLIQDALPYCQTKAITQHRQGEGRSTETQKEQRSEKEQIKEQIKEKQYFTQTSGSTSSHLVAEIVQPWTIDELLKFSHCIPNEKKIKCLDDILMQELPKDKRIFSPDLWISTNYHHVYKKQTPLIEPRLKPIQIILWRMYRGKVSACVIDNEEAKSLTRLLPIPYVWLSNTQHTILAGERPDGVLESIQYQQLHEQIKFLAGEWQTLATQSTPYTWLQNDLTEKLYFYTKYLLPIHNMVRSDYDFLITRVLKKVETQSSSLAITQTTINFNAVNNESLALHALSPTALAIRIEETDINDRFAILMTYNDNQETLLDIACHFPEQWSMLLKLLRFEDQIKATEYILIKHPYNWKIVYEFPTIVQHLIDKTLASDRLELFMHQDDDGKSLLHQAMEYPNILNLMLDSLTPSEQMQALTCRDNKGLSVLMSLLMLNQNTKLNVLFIMKNSNYLSIIAETPAFQSFFKVTRIGPYLHIELTESYYQIPDIIIGEFNLLGHLKKHWPDSLPSIYSTVGKDYLMMFRQHNNVFKQLLATSCDEFRYALFKQILSVTDTITSLLLFTDYPEVLGNFLQEMPTNEWLSLLKSTNFAEISILDILQHKPELKSRVIQDLPKWQTYQLNLDKQGNNELHLKAQDPDALRELLESIPAEERFAAVMEMNKLKQTVVDLALENPVCYAILSAAIPKEDRAWLNVDTLGNIALHLALQDPPLFQNLLLAIPESYRFRILMKKNKQGQSVLDGAIHNPQTYEILLDALSDQERYKAFIDPISGDHLLKDIKWRDNNPIENQAIRKRILMNIPEKYRYYAYTTRDPENGASLQDYVKRHPEAVEEFIQLLPLSGQYKLNNKLHNALEHKDPHLFQTLMQTLPINERFDILMYYNSPGYKLHFAQKIEDVDRTYSFAKDLHPSNIVELIYTKEEPEQVYFMKKDLARDSLNIQPSKDPMAFEELKRLQLSCLSKLKAQQNPQSWFKQKTVVCEDEPNILVHLEALTGYSFRKTLLQLALEHNISLDALINMVPESQQYSLILQTTRLRFGQQEDTFLHRALSSQTDTQEEKISQLKDYLNRLNAEDAISVLLMTNQKRKSVLNLIIECDIPLHLLFTLLPDTSHNKIMEILVQPNNYKAIFLQALYKLQPIEFFNFLPLIKAYLSPANLLSLLKMHGELLYPTSSMEQYVQILALYPPEARLKALLKQSGYQTVATFLWRFIDMPSELQPLMPLLPSIDQIKLLQSILAESDEWEEIELTDFQTILRNFIRTELNNVSAEIIETQLRAIECAKTTAAIKQQCKIILALLTTSEEKKTSDVSTEIEEKIRSLNELGQQLIVEFKKCKSRDNAAEIINNSLEWIKEAQNQILYGLTDDLTEVSIQYYITDCKEIIDTTYTLYSVQQEHGDYIQNRQLAYTETIITNFERYLTLIQEIISLLEEQFAHNQENILQTPTQQPKSSI